MGKKLLIIYAILLVLPPLVVANGQEFTPTSLTVRIYPDGSTDLDYRLETDPTEARVEIPIFGGDLQDILVLDQDGTPLEWDITVTGILIDTLGSTEVQITYTTSSLTNKTGTKWSVRLTSPVNTVYTLPVNAILVGLEPVPLEVSLVENQVTVTMPNGTSMISYLLGTTGTRERALVLLKKAEGTVNEAKNKGLILGEANSLLSQAQAAFDTGDYSQSERLSQETIDEVQKTESMAEEAEAQINETESLIREMEGSVNQADINRALDQLDSAEEAYSQGEYNSAYSLAMEAYQIASKAGPRRANNTYLIASGVIIILLGLGVLYFWRRSSGSESRPESRRADVDLDRIFEEHPTLRTDEKAVLRYTHESGGAFITDIRERFDIPKSTAWRMMNRLEEAGLIETEMVGRETYIQIKEEGVEPSSL